MLRINFEDTVLIKDLKELSRLKNRRKTNNIKLKKYLLLKLSHSILINLVQNIKRFCFLGLLINAV